MADTGEELEHINLRKRKSLGERIESSSSPSSSSLSLRRRGRRRRRRRHRRDLHARRGFYRTARSVFVTRYGHT